MVHTETAYVGIGSNIEPEQHVPQVLRLLRAQYGQLDVSPVYRCSAVGFSGAAFLNLVVAFSTAVQPAELVAQLHAVESQCGRERETGLSSRTMDLDLLLYGDQVIEGDGFSLPRNDILRYAFVLRPLAEIAGDARHPVDGRSYRQLWAAFAADDQPLEPVALQATDR